MREIYDGVISTKTLLEDMNDYRMRTDLETFFQLQDREDPDISIRFDGDEGFLSRLLYIPKQDRIVVSSNYGTSVSLNRVSEKAEIAREVIPASSVNGIFVEYSFVYENMTATLDIIFPIGEQMEYSEGWK